MGGVLAASVLYLTSMSDRLLIVDDDEQLIRAYKEHFSDLGYQVDCAQELEEAQTLLTHFRYCSVITDLRLSKLGFGGLELVKYIRDLRLPTRVIVLTSYGWPEIKGEAIAQKVDAFLQKPIRVKDVAEKISLLKGADA